MASNKQRGLGRDLGALLGRRVLPEAITLNQGGEQLTQLAVDALQSGRYQPRRDMEPEALQDLANSIRSQGIIQPLIVRPISDKKYEIIAGERRWRAAQLAGLTDVPVVIKQVDDEAAGAMALIENVQRQDLNAMEEALAYHRLTEEFGLTHQEVADLVGKSRAMISNLLRLINLNSDVKTFLEHGDLEMGHARALLALTGHVQSETARTIVGKSLSVREAERLVQQTLKPPVAKKPAATLDPDTRRLQNELSEKLGAKVDIQHNPKGHGQLVINYHSLEALEGILAHIK